MTSTYSNRIITLAERNAMLGDGVSNAELRTLLAGVDKQGIPVIGRERIKEMIDSYQVRGVFGFKTGIEESGFEAPIALKDLQNELTLREQNVAGNAEQVGRYVQALSAYNTGAKYNAFFPQANSDLIAYLNGVFEGERNTIAEDTKTSPNLAPDALKALTCEYALQVATISQKIQGCPAIEVSSFGFVSGGMPKSGQML